MNQRMNEVGEGNKQPTKGNSIESHRSFNKVYRFPSFETGKKSFREQRQTLIATRRKVSHSQLILNRHETIVLSNQT